MFRAPVTSQFLPLYPKSISATGPNNCACLAVPKGWCFLSATVSSTCVSPLLLPPLKIQLPLTNTVDGDQTRSFVTHCGPQYKHQPLTAELQNSRSVTWDQTELMNKRRGWNDTRNSKLRKICRDSDCQSRGLKDRRTVVRLPADANNYFPSISPRPTLGPGPF